VSQVLALKYRPSSFEKLIGQESITQTLTQALDQNRLSHAYLFSGLRGSGKTSTARIFAKCLVCESGPTSTPCESCENCRMANENRHIDIIEMDAASSRKIDDIRALIEQTKYKPNSAAYKIFIIDEVHMLTKEAFNALLKTLEEPPEYVKFILATTDPMKLPPTILSRTQHFRFKKIPQGLVVKHLSHILNLEEIPFEPEALGILTRAGNGSLRDTLTLLDQAIIYSKNYVDAKSVAEMLGVLDPEVLSAIFDAILKNDRETIIETIKELENYEGEVVIDELISYLRERFFSGDPRFSTMLIDRFFKILSESKRLLFINADTTFVLTLLFFKMVEATKIKAVDEMIEQLEAGLSVKNVQPQSSAQKPTQKPSQPQHATSEPKVNSKPQEQPKTETKSGFQLLIEKLYDRNYELGECFEKSITFIDFSNHTLTMMSCADENCKKLLRLSSGLIKHFVKEVYGLESKIAMQKCDKAIDQKAEPTQSTAATEEKEEKEEIENPHPTDSCIANETIGNTEKSEIDGSNILEDPFVKTAGELFEPSRIIVKSKV
jgi:DNA polymerase-3 subunit gamma/tau